MKLVKKTDKYTVYQKRSDRYAVKDSEKKWVLGDDKVAILIEEGLMKKPEPKPEPEPEQVEEETAEANEEETPAEE